MTKTFEISETAKALKVCAAARTMKAECVGAGNEHRARLFDELLCLPMDSLAKLHDLILTHDTAAGAAASLETA